MARLVTSSAGGHDDGESSLATTAVPGSQITVGGTGDNNVNPIDASEDAPENTRYDDELYQIKNYLDQGNTTFELKTENSAGDDNIMFVGTIMSNPDRSLTLAPATSSGPHHNRTNGDGHLSGWAGRTSSRGHTASI